MEPARRMPQIMVVDDDPDTILILTRHLQREGFETVEAGSGAECLRMVKLDSVDVIVLDLMMPDMDGFAVCRALKQDPETASIPIIMVTARDDLDARAEGIRLGVSDFIAKPVFRRQLANRVRAQLEMLAATRVNDSTLRHFEPPVRNGRAPR
ncbi:MAG TPA: response regulator [Candidatus Binataceae bacterium]|nr:response regulator [Candidatus Binataceae bacterium]